jgi:NAD(P)H-flavin reductase
MVDDLDLTLVHVLEEPPDGWDGASGSRHPDLLDRLVPDHEAEQWRYVLCGPPPMMEAVEGSLVDHGVPMAASSRSASTSARPA